ncbi:MAG: sulfur oxidation c-type cytochrome SoxX [Burkholderiales bacterium]
MKWLLAWQMGCLAAGLLGVSTSHAQLPGPSAPAPLAIGQVGDAVPESLTQQPGNPVAGRAIVANRQVGLCLLCHSGPFPEEPQQGNLAPSLAGAGARWSPGQLRLRLVDARLLNPNSIMPPYYNPAGLQRVGNAWQGKPLLKAQEIEDVVAFLSSLRE